MQKGSLFLIAAGLFLVFFSILYVSLQKPVTPHHAPFASITPLIRQVMVVDINKTGNFTPQAVLSGQLPILGINPITELSDYQHIQLNFLEQVGRLFAYTLSNPNNITNLDPVFNRMALVYISAGKIANVIPISEVGIRSIYLDPQHRVPTELFPGGPKGYWQVVNTAILVDGSKREIRVIPMNSGDLPNQ